MFLGEAAYYKYDGRISLYGGIYGDFLNELSMVKSNESSFLRQSGCGDHSSTKGVQDILQKLVFGLQPMMKVYTHTQSSMKSTKTRCDLPSFMNALTRFPGHKRGGLNLSWIMKIFRCCSKQQKRTSFLEQVSPKYPNLWGMATKCCLHLSRRQWDGVLEEIKYYEELLSLDEGKFGCLLWLLPVCIRVWSDLKVVLSL